MTFKFASSVLFVTHIQLHKPSGVLKLRLYLSDLTLNDDKFHLNLIQ